MRRVVFLIIITLCGAFLRFLNLSPFTVYPDSFQNLLVAENLRIYGEVVGYLGKDGLLFPEVFSWSRPVYPLLINAVSFFGVSDFTAAQILPFVLGFLSIPVAFLFIRSFFKNTKAGLIGAGLLTLSYNHTVWSGMIMTESIGIFFMLLFLWRFFATVRNQNVFSLQTILTGFLLCLAVLERYEYMAVALPLIFLTFLLSPKPYKYLLVIFGSFLCGVLTAGLLIFPYQSVIPAVLSQVSDILLKITILIIAVLILVLGKRYLPRQLVKKILNNLPDILSILWIVFCSYLFLQIIFGQLINLFYSDFSFIRHFMKHDILLSILSFAGMLFLFRKEKYLATFVLLSTGILGYIYHQTNPDMERYMTHLIPFLLIPASYAVSDLVFAKQSIKQLPKKVTLYVLGFLILLQIILTAYGLRNLNDPSWFQPSYEEMAARDTGKYIKGDPILIVSFPEPYYYFLQKDTQSIADAPPFVYLPDSLKNRSILIVEDMGMHEVFPTFTTFLHKKLGNYKIASFYTHEDYHYTNQTKSEDSQVILYKIKLGELKRIINLNSKVNS